MSRTRTPKATGTKKTMMAEGGKVGERIYKVGLADPRSGPTRLADAAHRVIQGGPKAPVRRWDDSPAKQQANRAAVKRR